MKQFTALFLCFSMLINTTIYSDTNSRNSIISMQPQKQPHTRCSTVLPRLILGASFLTVCYAISSPYVQKQILKQLNPTKLVPIVINEFLINFIVNGMHEFGHALAAKIINNDEIDIHLGGNSFDGSNPIIKTKHITLHGIDPLAGYTLFTMPKSNGSPDTAKYAAILLAGPISGIISNVILKQAKFFLKEGKWTSAIQLIADPLTIMQLFNLFIPFEIGESGNNDASKLYQQCLNINPVIIKKLSTLTIPLAILSEIFLTHKEITNHSKVAAHSIILLACANFLLKGIARFNI